MDYQLIKTINGKQYYYNMRTGKLDILTTLINRYPAAGITLLVCLCILAKIITNQF